MEPETDAPPDIGTAINAPAEPGHGWRPITRTEPPVDQDADLLLCIAYLEFDGDRRTGNVVGWRTYVGRRLAVTNSGCGDFDEPESMSSMPSASWLNEDSELADVPSYWQPAPKQPELLPPEPA